MSDPHITILMATYDGDRFLAAQLNSLVSQTYQNWSLLVSDDGSRDNTVPILQNFGRQNPGRNVRLVGGPGLGAAQNFMTLLTRHDLQSGMVALADQDDVWLPQKLTRAVSIMRKCPADSPVIYASQSILTDESLKPLRQNATPAVQPDFRNALVQNLFAGHSTILNAAALSLVRRAGKPQTIAFHDWWLYQLVAGAGGTCLLDPAKTVLYRQHDRNAFGASQGLAGPIKRLGHLLRNDYGNWLHGHWQALLEATPLLTPEAGAIVRVLCASPLGGARATQFRRLGVHRGSARGTAALWLAARLGHI